MTEQQPEYDPDAEVLPALDRPPRDGVYRHLEDRPLTDYEAARGNDLGRRIRVDDDADNGIGEPAGDAP